MIFSHFFQIQWLLKSSKFEAEVKPLRRHKVCVSRCFNGILYLCEYWTTTNRQLFYQKDTPLIEFAGSLYPLKKKAKIIMMHKEAREMFIVY